MASASDETFLRLAIARARRAGILERTGGPFGAVIVRGGEVLAVEARAVWDEFRRLPDGARY